VNVLVYAITRDDARAPASRELREICAAGLRALAEPVEDTPPADLEQLVHYEATVEALMETHTVLPMRFGSIVNGEDGVRDLLKSRAREFMDALSQLDGAVEYGVRASTESDLPVASGDEDLIIRSGESYMRARLREQQLRRELQAWLDGALGGVVRESVYRETPVSQPGSIRAAYLVDREAVDEFLLRVTELADNAEHTLSWSGPWPPYTFAQEVRE
jgi:Gas vesicle synthesis protein GvpL/GvpF